MASHGDLRAGYESAKKCSKLAETSQPLEKKSRKVSGSGAGEREKVKKKHKKSHKHHGHHSHHSHHHCHKHKHKRHKSGENKRQFAVRSPHYVKSEQDSSDHSENVENNEQSPEESEQQNSSEDEREVRPDLDGRRGGEGREDEYFSFKPRGENFLFIEAVKTKLLHLLSSLEIMK